jgi:hypothetical protein
MSAPCAKYSGKTYADVTEVIVGEWTNEKLQPSKSPADHFQIFGRGSLAQPRNAGEFLGIYSDRD